MRVKFTKTVMGDRIFYPENEERDLPAEAVAEYLRLGWAVPIDGGAEVAVSRKPVEKAVRPIRGAQRGA